MSNLIDNVNTNHHNPEKNVVPSENNSVRNVIDCKSAEIRFDGCTRIEPLPNRRLIIFTEKGPIYIMSLIFDQAEIDVADAIFTQIKCD